MSNRTTLIVFLVLTILAVTGCRQRARHRAAPGTNDKTASDPHVGEGTGGEEPQAVGGFNSLVVDQSRAQAMEDAYQALIQGDATGVSRVLALGADMDPVIEMAIRSGNIHAMTGAIRVLKDVGGDPAPGLLLEALDSSVLSVQMESLDAIGALKLSEGVSRLVESLSHEELVIRATACDALSKFERLTDGSLSAIFSRVSDDEPVVRASCARAFSLHATTEAWGSRVGRLILSERSVSQAGALRVLGAWKTPWAFDLIKGRLQAPEILVVATALAAISKYGDGPAFLAIEPFLKDTRLTVRVEAVAALQRLPAASVHADVKEALKDPSPLVRLEATSQLARYPKDAEVSILLVALLRDEDIGVRDAAALVAQELSDPRLFSDLLERLDEETDPGVKQDLVDALGRSAPDRAIPHFIDRLDGAEGAIRARLLILLREQTGQSFPADTETWRVWYRQEQASEPAPVSPPPASEVVSP